MTSEEWARLPVTIRDNLRRKGIYPDDMNALQGILSPPAPYTKSGATGLLGEYTVRDMSSNLQGVTLNEGNDATSNRSLSLLNPQGSDIQGTRAHEIEHALAMQGLGDASAINTKWDELSKTKRGDMVRRLLNVAPYLVSNWGLPKSDAETGYFSSNVKGRPDTNNFLYEQMATLSALEQKANKRLTDDPYLREHVFQNDAERETYNALTGLRQTRLDAKDLPPYTRQPDKPTTNALYNILNQWFK